MELRDRSILLALAEVATPAGELLRPPDVTLPERALEAAAELSPFDVRAYLASLRALDLAAVPLTGRRLAALPVSERAETLDRLSASLPTHWLVRVATAPIKRARAREPELAAALGLPASRPRMAVVREREGYLERVVDARDLDDGEQLEADVVVVGTGAGGAPVARRLAAQGHAVVLLEEGGGPRSRADYGRDPLRMQRELFRKGGATVAIGNAMIPIPVGMGVGGSTTVNSGTCFRPPASVMRRWELDDGLAGLGPDGLAPYLDRVEHELQVAPSAPDVLGESAAVIARGAEALGYAHGPLSRNAPGCDGQGVCCFGCPTGAKRSTDVSYVPAALRAGAMLFTHARVTAVIVEAGRAVGVRASVRHPDGSRRTLTVRATAVVLSCGALHTPALLLRQRLANGSGQVGRNLTIHPASYAWARMDEPVRGWGAVPQGYAVDELVDQGIRFEGAFVPIGIAAPSLAQVGASWTSLVESFDRLACFGFMITDRSRGRVTVGRGREPRVTYRVVDEDRRKLVLAHAVLARMFLAGGAREVHPAVRGHDTIRGEADVRRLLGEGMRRVRPHDVDITAYHPLGTCRMGADARRSVIGPGHEAHEVPGLFVSDGSAVPGPLGVNPQVTIMAFAERAAEHVARRVERAEGAARVAVPARRIEFAETMAGTCVLEGEDGRAIAARFRVGAYAEPDVVGSLRDRGGTLRLAGRIDIEGLATAQPCAGTLEVRPLRSRATLVYDLDMRDDEGRPLHLHGEKHVRLGDALGGMTTLHTEVRRDDGEILARGVLRFDVRDLRPFLASFRVTDAA